jgi:hypothetical protein
MVSSATLASETVRVLVIFRHPIIFFSQPPFRGRACGSIASKDRYLVYKYRCVAIFPTICSYFGKFALEYWISDRRHTLDVCNLSNAGGSFTKLAAIRAPPLWHCRTQNIGWLFFIFAEHCFTLWIN